MDYKGAVQITPTFADGYSDMKTSKGGAGRSGNLTVPHQTHPASVDAHRNAPPLTRIQRTPQKQQPYYFKLALLVLGVTQLVACTLCNWTDGRCQPACGRHSASIHEYATLICLDLGSLHQPGNPSLYLIYLKVTRIPSLCSP